LTTTNTMSIASRKRNPKRPNPRAPRIGSITIPKFHRQRYAGLVYFAGITKPADPLPMP
jgi:hypothetical protein